MTAPLVMRSRFQVSPEAPVPPMARAGPGHSREVRSVSVRRKRPFRGSGRQLPRSEKPAGYIPVSAPVMAEGAPHAQMPSGTYRTTVPV